MIDSTQKFMSVATTEVARYFNDHLDTSNEDDRIYAEDVYCVWSCKALQNFKGLFSTPVPDGMYYEITYNGDKDEMYLDAYKKWENKVIKM